MKKLLLALAMSAVAINSYSDNTSFNSETSVIHIPVVEVSGSPIFSNVELKLRSDGLFELIAAEEYKQPPPSQGTGESNGDYMISQIKGEFTGWDGNTIFELTNGQIWKQANFEYMYHYAFMPRVKIVYNNGTYQMEVEYVTSKIQVVRVK